MFTREGIEEAAWDFGLYIAILALVLFALLVIVPAAVLLSVYEQITEES